MERRVQEVCRRGIEQGLIRSAHDCSDGGLAVALAECCIQGGVGFQGILDAPSSWDAALFGERQSRIVVAVEPGRIEELDKLAHDAEIPVMRLGNTGGDNFFISGIFGGFGEPVTNIDVPVAHLTAAWSGGLEAAGG
jgi:phosphoribosylformylglycinamidine synthase